MSVNVVDNRKRKYRWKCGNAVLENTHHDNACADADQARSDSAHQLTYDDRKSISVNEAIAWGMGQTAEVTLFRYDEGEGI